MLYFCLPEQVLREAPPPPDTYWFLGEPPWKIELRVPEPVELPEALEREARALARRWHLENLYKCARNRFWDETPFDDRSLEELLLRSRSPRLTCFYFFTFPEPHNANPPVRMLNLPSLPKGWGGLQLKSKRCSDRAVEVFDGPVHGVDIARLPGRRVTERNMRAWGLSVSDLRVNGHFPLEEVLQDMRECRPYVEAARLGRLVSEPRYLALATFGMRRHLEAIARISAPKAPPANAKGWKNWEKRSDRAFDRMREVRQEIRDEADRIFGPGSGLLFRSPYGLESNYRLFKARLREGIGIPHPEDEEAEIDERATNMLDGSIRFGEPGDFLSDLARMNPAFGLALERLKHPVLEDYARGELDCRAEIEKLRNPNDDREALRRGVECEVRIDSVVRAIKLDEFEGHALSPRTWNRTNFHVPLLVDWLGSVRADRAEDELRRRLVGQGISWMERREDFPEDFWKRVASSRETSHLDLLCAFWNGKAEVPGLWGSMLPKIAEACLMSIAADWFKPPRLVVDAVAPPPGKGSPMGRGRPRGGAPDRRLAEQIRGEWLAFKATSPKATYEDFAFAHDYTADKVKRAVDRARRPLARQSPVRGRR